MKKIFRTIILSALVLALTSLGLPASDALARLSRRAVAAAHRRGNHRHCRHTRAWWRRHRRQARARQERAMLERRRRRQAAMLSEGTRHSAAGSNLFRKVRAGAPEVQGPRSPFDFAMPQAWRLAGAGGEGSLKFAVTGRDGKAAGSASLSPFTLSGPSAAQDVITPRTKLIGGVPLPVLRRAIIDRMVVEGGWVTNDLEREIEGRRVYVVVAQKGDGGVASESMTFYFTEVEGRLYSLATNSPVQSAAPVAADSEQLLSTLRAGGGGSRVSPALAIQSPR